MNYNSMIINKFNSYTRIIKVNSKEGDVRVTISYGMALDKINNIEILSFCYPLDTFVFQYCTISVHSYLSMENKGLNELNELYRFNLLIPQTYNIRENTEYLKLNDILDFFKEHRRLYYG